MPTQETERPAGLLGDGAGECQESPLPVPPQLDVSAASAAGGVAPPGRVGTLDQALEQSRQVEQKVAAVAGDVRSTNRQLKERISRGAKTLPAGPALTDGERVENTVEEVASDLREVNDVLAAGAQELRVIELGLADARSELEQTEASLAQARHDEHDARLRALHDALTGLPNRELFDDRLSQAIALAERQAWTLAVLFLDLDGFKLVNDGHGHAAGDAVLKAIAMRLTQASRDQDTVCRNGGDEFLVLLVNAQGRENIERVATALRAAIAEPVAIRGARLTVGVSIGIACYPEHGLTSEQLVGHADAAMYRAKRAGGGHALWDPSVSER